MPTPPRGANPRLAGGTRPQWTVCGSEPQTRSRRHRPADEPPLRHLVQLARVAGQFEEGHQPGSFSRAEAITQLLEVAREETGRIAVALARLVGELLGLGA